MNDELRQALAEAPSAGAAFAAAIRLGKAKNPKLTLGFVARRAGIPSTGYLSDVLTGRRKLHAKYRAPLLKALDLSGTAAELITRLSALDDGSEGEERAQLDADLEALRKVLRLQTRALPERLAGTFFAFEVFAAFGLTGQRASRADLRRFFGTARGIELEGALAQLMQAGLVEREDEEFRIVSDQINFIAGADGISHIDYLTMALRDAEKRVAAWCGKKDESFFSSSILSVKASQYREALPRIKETVQKLESDLESGEADRLVRFNVQIFPLDGDG